MLLKFFFEFWCKFLGEFGVDDFFAGFDKFGFSFVFARFFMNDAGAACEDDFVNLEI